MTNQMSKVSRIFAVLAACLLSMGIASAQNRAISGTVVDASGEPIIGASVVVVGNSTIGAVTDLDGKFAFSVPA